MTYIKHIGMSINVKNLSFSFEKESIVKNLSFEVSNGTVGLIKGESGSGKSTLLNVVAGLKRPDSGSVICNNSIFNDNETFLAPENRKIGYVFQDFALFPHINAIKNITYALNKKFLFTEFVTLSLNLNKHLQKMPHELSGGQQQRIAIARALTMWPELLILDEPFSNLDKKNSINAQKLISKFVKDWEIPCLLVSHDDIDFHELPLEKEIIIA